MVAEHVVHKVAPTVGLISTSVGIALNWQAVAFVVRTFALIDVDLCTHAVATTTTTNKDTTRTFQVVKFTTYVNHTRSGTTPQGLL